MAFLVNVSPLSVETVLFRLFLSFIAGALIGAERSHRRQNAGLRTHILISLGSTLLMMLSIWLPAQWSSGYVAGVSGDLSRIGDPGRIAAQVVSGIGFLGAGSIIRLGNTIKGLTTAATLWFVAAIGLGLGAGMYIPVIAALVFGLVSLIALEPLERFFFPTERFKQLTVEFSENDENTYRVTDILLHRDVSIQSIDVERDLDKKMHAVRFLVRLPSSLDAEELSKRIISLPGVKKMELKEKF